MKEFFKSQVAKFMSFATLSSPQLAEVPLLEQEENEKERQDRIEQGTRAREPSNGKQLNALATRSSSVGGGGVGVISVPSEHKENETNILVDDRTAKKWDKYNENRQMKPLFGDDAILKEAKTTSYSTKKPKWQGDNDKNIRYDKNTQGEWSGHKPALFQKFYKEDEDGYISVKSSNLAAVKYDRQNKRLYVKFKRGTEYEYEDVPIGKYNNLMAWSSHGSYFYWNIRGAGVPKPKLPPFIYRKI